MLKFSGLAVIFCACTLFGFSKSRALTLRCERIMFYKKATVMLCEKIKADAGELDTLISECFENTVTFSKGRLCFDKDYLKSEDISLLCELFDGIGLSDKQSEIKRISLYCTVLDTNYRDAVENKKTLSKLYGSGGVLTGLMLCIFFI